MSRNLTVSLYIPTFRNSNVFEACFQSYLRQSYKNIEVHIFDNGFADGYPEIRYIVEKVQDPRVKYHCNLTNIGPTANYNQIFSVAEKADVVVFLAADIGLADNAVEIMLSKMLEQGSSVVVPRAANFRHDIVGGDGLPTYDQPAEIVESVFEGKERELAGAEVLSLFYSEENIASEFYNFSIFGALIDGALIRALPKQCVNYRYHGFEQLMSMQLALLAPRISFIPQVCFQCFVGQPRVGGTERPNNFLTRYEPILAAEVFLRDNEAMLIATGIELRKFREFQLKKIRFFRKNYMGFEAALLRIAVSNHIMICIERLYTLFGRRQP